MSDTEAPAVVSGGTTVIVAGSGMVTIAASVIGQGYQSGFQSTATLYRNGTAVGSVDFVLATQQTLTISWTGGVVDGDLITLGWQTRAYTTAAMLAGTYVEIAAV